MHGGYGVGAAFILNLNFDLSMGACCQQGGSVHLHTGMTSHAHVDQCHTHNLSFGYACDLRGGCSLTRSSAAHSPLRFPHLPSASRGGFGQQQLSTLTCLLWYISRPGYLHKPMRFWVLRRTLCT